MSAKLEHVNQKEQECLINALFKSVAENAEVNASGNACCNLDRTSKAEKSGAKRFRAIHRMQEKNQF